MRTQHIHGFLAKAAASLLLLAAASLQAQPAGKSYKVALLSLASGPGDPPALMASLKDLGYVEGRNLTMERRYAAGSFDRLELYARELAGSGVDVIIATATPPAKAAQQATTSIPIVFVSVVDPVGSGLVTSLARPGRNLTGVSLLSTELSAKRLELLQEVVPAIANVGVLINESNPSHMAQLKEIQSAAGTRGIKIRVLGIKNATDIDRALAASATSAIDALVAVDDPIIVYERDRIARLANARRIPSIWGFPEFAESGFLISYGPDTTDQFRRGAHYVHRILQGARPAELPVEQPAKFTMAVNLRTARALAVNVPRQLLLRADEVIE